MYIGKARRDGKLRKILACLPPVIINAVFVGAVIAYGIATAPGSTDAFWPAYTVAGLQVGFGELVVLYALGFPALIILPQTKFFKTLLSLYTQGIQE
jgi:threonine/homoserine efflux transporter RhtA